MATSLTISIPKYPAMLLLLFLITSPLPFPVSGAQPGVAAEGGESEANMYFPVGHIEDRTVDAVLDSSPVLEPFKKCEQCRCCFGGDTASCKSMQCCYGIKCHLPGKPPEVCAFAPPIECNCASCP